MRAAKASSNDEPDYNEATGFLDRLKAKNCTFQTFDDNAERKNPKLASILHGSFEEHQKQLAQLNGLGAGVFVSLNETNLTGRKRENIKRVRAVCLDLDGAPLDPVKQCTLKPHVIVETSPGRYHVYWRVRGLALDDFEDVQRAIAKRFDGDPSVAKLTHVARVPGFDHRKGSPFRTHTVVTNDLPPYNAEEIKGEFPPESTPHKPPVSAGDRLILPHDEPLTCAHEFVERNFRTPQGELCLHFYRGSWYKWTPIIQSVNRVSFIASFSSF
jgi:RepB DNA-primase from phage plasmid